MIHRITNRRNLKKANKVIVDDFEDRLEDEALNETEQMNTKSRREKIIALIAPFILNEFYQAMNAQKTMTYQREVYSLAEKQLMEYTDHITKLLDNAQTKLNELDIDKNVFKELQQQGEDILSSINVADKSNVRAYQELSPALLQQSLDNKASQVEALADYTYNTNLLDYNNERLYTHKTWLWSTLENTRHESMDGTIIPIDELFVIVNDITGDTDYGLYPRDSNIGDSNLINCACDITYSNEDKI